MDINTENKINWRQFGRHWIVVFILAILAGLTIFFMLRASTILKRLEDYASNVGSPARQYQEDKFGGDSPDSTFDLFVLALEKQDVDLASKYFVGDKQAYWDKILTEYKTKKVLADFLAEIKGSSAVRDEAKFEQYHNGTWKIDSL